MSNDRYMTANEAAKALDVSTNTIYAYVSRKLIRSEASADGKRNRRYLSEDIEKLLNRRQARRNPDQLTQDALHWGTPVLESSITLIDNGHLYYRGLPIDEVIETLAVEQVASLIWTGDIANADKLFDPNLHPTALKYETMLLHVEVDGADLVPIQAFQIVLPIAMADDLTSYDMRPEVIATKGARVLRLMTSVAAGDVEERVSVAEMLCRGWCPDDKKSIHVFNTAMILCADHELNVSSFTARVVASAGATPYAVVNAGLSALQGVRHGGNTESVEAFFEEVGTPDQIESVISARMRRGELKPVPGFGQRLYPDGDPRAKILCDILFESYPDSPEIKLAQAVKKTVFDMLGEYPTIDFALAVIGRLYKLQPGSALGIFALGRMIGWIGHAIEQYEDGQLIRPRAKYIGNQPQSDGDV
jgi:citrate synthase